MKLNRIEVTIKLPAKFTHTHTHTHTKKRILNVEAHCSENVSFLPPYTQAGQLPDACSRENLSGLSDTQISRCENNCVGKPL